MADWATASNQYVPSIRQSKTTDSVLTAVYFQQGLDLK